MCAPLVKAVSQMKTEVCGRGAGLCNICHLTYLSTAQPLRVTINE
jgi:hypothetical protein